MIIVGIRVSDHHGLFKYSRKLVLIKLYIYNGLEYSFERLLIRLNISKSYSRWMGDTTQQGFVTEVRSTNRWWFIDSPSGSSEVSRPGNRGCPVELFPSLGSKAASGYGINFWIHYRPGAATQTNQFWENQKVLENGLKGDPRVQLNLVACWPVLGDEW